MKLTRASLLWVASTAAACVLGVQCGCWPWDDCHKQGTTCLWDDCPTPGPSCDKPQPAFVPLPASPTLQGFVDLHTHPMSSLGFAGGLVYGGIDEWALLPLDPDCNHDVDAGSVEQALGHCGSTHDGNIDNRGNKCGDDLRELFVTTLDLANDANDPPPDSYGYPYFDKWPKWNEVSHQVMWVEWIRRAYLGGLRVMVALAVNNKTIADVVQGTGGNNPHHPDDDMNSADQQILQLKAFVGRHADFMGIASTADEVKQLVQDNKLAVVLGLEVDNIGDFNQMPGVTEADVHAEILRLYGTGVRYLFPIHVLDNKFGTAAYYNDLFNISNFFEAGHFMNLECAQPTDQIDQLPAWCQALSSLLDPFQNLPSKAELAAVAVFGLGKGDVQESPICPSCGLLPDGRKIGYVNRGVPYPGLTPLGKFAILDMMRQGILIDVDHMSQASAEDTLALALQENYPVNSGHNQLRMGGGSERNMSADGYAKIGKVHGMAGVGLANLDEVGWIDKYQQVIQALGRADAVAGFGTDANGVSPLMKPPPAELPPLLYSDDAGYPQSGLGQMCWDYNQAGVAHYGLLSDLVRTLPQADGGASVQSNLMQGAQYFYDTWKLAEAYKDAHAGDAGFVVASVHIAPKCSAGTVYAAECRRCLPPSTPCAQAPPICEAPRVLDEWGTCVSRPVSRARLSAEPSVEALTAPVILPTGMYTLHLEAKTAQAGPPGGQIQDFAFPLTASGRALTLGTKPATQWGAVAGAGGFRRNRFFMRVSAGTQRLALLAIVPQGDSLDEMRGAFVSYAPGRSTTRGAFRLRRVAPEDGAPQAGAPLNVLSPFLESLSEQVR